MFPGLFSTPAAGQVSVWQKSGEPNIIQLGSAWAPDLYLDRQEPVWLFSFLFYYLFF